MNLDDMIFGAGLFACICAVALAAVLLADLRSIQEPEPSCRWVATEVVPAGFVMFQGGVRVERPAYEVDVLMCGENRVVQLR